MPQRFQFDPRGRLSYLALTLIACSSSKPGSVVPEAAAPVTLDQVRQWVDETAPRGHRTYRFRWQLQDERGAAGGRGTGRLAAPDSVRLDVAGPLGAGRGAAVVVGDTALWTDPPDVIERLVPSYPLMWAMFGVARMPAAGAALRGVADSIRTVWQAVEGADTVTYIRERSPARLVAEVRSRGKVVGRVETDLGADGQPASSRLNVPSVPARLNLTFTASAASAPFSPTLWRPGEP
jgi:hypothetical protein